MKTVQLSELCDINPESIAKDYPYDFIEYIDISSVSSGHLAISPQLLSISEAPSRAKRIVKNEDIIISMVRPNLRSFMFITNPKENTIVSTGFAVLRTKPGIYPGFVYYAITDHKFTEYLANNAIGTSYPAVDTDTILRGEIPNFSYDIQHKIASILSAYDSLIENNRRRIQLLEHSARLLYREWFIYLRFPGHEHVRIIDGVPEGWEKKSLGGIIEIKKGKNITKETVINGKVPVVAGGLNPAYFHNKPNTTGPVITISASGANAGYVNIYHEDIWASDCSYISEKSTEHIYYYYSLLKSKQKEIFGLQKGTAQPHVYPKDLMRLSVVSPPDKILGYFSDTTSHAFIMIKNLITQNKSLIQARDILLPRLMNGEITV